MKIKIDDATLHAAGDSWADVMEQITIGRLKYLIGDLVEFDYISTDSEQRLLRFPESVGSVKERLALSLLYQYPDRITREGLTLSASVSMGSLRNYLTNSDLDVEPHIEEDQRGVALKYEALDWAISAVGELVP